MKANIPEFNLSLISSWI